jgi:hypothetical protein
MNLKLKQLTIIAAFCTAPVALHAQFDFTVDGRDVQFHSFVQQGFAYSNQNNFLTMPTSNGSFAMTDAGVNVSTSLTDKFRVGAQVYARNIGNLGDYHVELDWAYGDYKFKDWFGIRAGKVKTALGLFNDIQDMEFLQTWALLPQSIYPLDLRSNTIAHTGGDVYGQIGLRKAGSLSYTGYLGTRPNDKWGGVYIYQSDAGSPVKSFSGKTAGGDLRWHTPISGLMAGGSWADETQNLNLTLLDYGGSPLAVTSHPEHLTSGYADYARGKWHFNGEYRRDYNMEKYIFLGYPSGSNQSTKAFFVTAAYRVSKRLEIGTYQSRYYVDFPQNPANTASNHIFDQVVTARFDITKWWNVKIEEHFMNGYGDTYSAHGFYSGDNPAGLKPTTDMFVIRMGYAL